MDLCGSHFAKRPRTEEEDKPSDHRPARKGQRKPSRSSVSDLEEDGSLISMLAKLYALPGGPAKSDPSRQELHLLCSGRKRQHSAADAEDLKGLAWAEGVRPGHHLVATTHVSFGIRGTGLSCLEATLRIKRSRIDSSPSEQASIDSNQFMELPSMGLQRKNSEACSPRSPSIRGSRSFDPEDTLSGSSGGPDPPLLGTEAYASGLDGHGFGCCALETGHLPEGTSGSGTLRCPTEIDRQRAYAADLCSNPTIDIAEVTIGSGHCNSLDEIRQAILALSLENGSNVYYINAELLAELWACCINDTFVWHAVGHWKDPLIRLLSCSNHHQLLPEASCLGHLLHS